MRHIYGDVTLVTKVRFHFWFLRSSATAFDHHFGWLWNCDDNFINNITLRLWKWSDFSTRRTVGIAGDDIMPTFWLVLQLIWNQHTHKPYEWPCPPRDESATEIGNESGICYTPLTSAISMCYSTVCCYLTIYCVKDCGKNCISDWIL